LFVLDHPELALANDAGRRALRHRAITQRLGIQCSRRGFSLGLDHNPDHTAGNKVLIEISVEKSSQ